YAYSNFGYCLLGQVIEAVSGQTYEAYVRKHVLQPAGLSGFEVGKTLAPAPREVAYYSAVGVGKAASVFDARPGETEWPYGGWCLENMDAHGGWTATAVDVLRFVLALDGQKGHQRILSADSIKTMLARPPAPLFSGEPYWYAMGLLVRPMDRGVNWWHLGSLDGTTTIMVRTFHGLAWVGLFNNRPQNYEEFNAALDVAFWKAVEGVTAWPTHNLFLGQ
ncbi:MAG TPA: serine hydrolase domain-containing protein, partial [Candidatus Ozemobacteraceae bacterium]|nr:serine hydrolase domain-containing protein [Candidatus Ozemobacteraceae bacterium]